MSGESRRDAIKRKILALQAKTAARGCTEAEAMAATETAARLMAEYGLTRDDIGAAEEGFSTITLKLGAPLSAMRWILPGIDELAGVVSNLISRYDAEFRRVTEARYHGTPTDLIFAEFLHATLGHAIKREVLAFKGSRDYRKRKRGTARRRAVADFREGMARRLQRRLRELAAANRGPVTHGGQALVTHKQAAIHAWMEANEMPLPETAEGLSKIRSRKSFAAGASAAGRVSINRPVGDDRAPVAGLLR